MTKLLPTLALSLFCSGCSNSGIVPMDKGTYMVMVRHPKVGFVSADDEKAAAYKQANAFCAKQGMALETIKLDLVPSGLARQASASLEFRCVPIR